MFLRGYNLYGAWWFKVGEMVVTRNAYQCRDYAIYLNQLGALPMVLPNIDSTSPVEARIVHKSVVNSENAATDNTSSIKPAKSDKNSGLNSGRWSAAEHNLFLNALKEHGEYWWRIAEILGTRNPTQVASHARTYFAKLKKERTLSAGTKRKASVAQGPETSKKLAVTSTSSSTTITAAPPSPLVYSSSSTSSEAQSVPSTLNLSSPGSAINTTFAGKTKPESHYRNSTIEETPSIKREDDGEEVPLKETKTEDNATLDLQLPSIKLEDDSNMSGSQKVEKPIDDEIETKHEATKLDDSCLRTTTDTEDQITGMPSRVHLKKKTIVIPFRLIVYLLLAATTIVFWELGTSKNIEYESHIVDFARREIIIGDGDRKAISDDAIDGKAVIDGGDSETATSKSTIDEYSITDIASSEVIIDDDSESKTRDAIGSEIVGDDNGESKANNIIGEKTVTDVRSDL